ncbi:MAG: inositol monophosphatase family protein [Anaerolineaceae bacterium]|jgi:myo-inositol-1(or 4)-monophosphatase
MSEDLSTYLDFAIETAYLAGRLTLGYFQTGIPADTKTDGSPVTQADRKAEELMRSRIERAYPRHAIVGEEFGMQTADGASHRWLIDPIDGTKSFVQGVPLYSVLLGLEIEGRVEVGVIYLPGLNEMVVAATGHGCWWNGRRARVSQVAQVEQAVAAFTEVRNFAKHGREAAFQRMVKRARLCMGWNDAYGYVLAATGRVEVMFDPIMAVWDCGPMPAIFREAGGYFGDWQGEETISGGEGLATSLVLLPAVLELLAGEESA